MPTYIMLSTLTPEGVQTVKNNPARIREVNKEVEQLGARARLARDRALRVARRDPDRRLHRGALRGS